MRPAKVENRSPSIELTLLGKSSMGGRRARAAQEFRALLLQVPRRLLIHVFEDRFQRRRRRLLADADGCAKALIDIGDECLFGAVIPGLATLEVLAPLSAIITGAALDRLVGLDSDDIAGGAITAPERSWC